MASIRSQILDYVAAKLNGTGKPTGLSVELMRLRNLEPVSLPFSVVRPTGEEVSLARPDNLRCPVVERTMRFIVDCFAEAGTGQTADDALDSLLVWTTKAILADPRMGGLAIHTSEDSTDREADETAAGTYARASISFTVRYRTSTNDQEAKA